MKIKGIDYNIDNAEDILSAMNVIIADINNIIEIMNKKFSLHNDIALTQSIFAGNAREQVAELKNNILEYQKLKTAIINLKRDLLSKEFAEEFNKNLSKNISEDIKESTNSLSIYIRNNIQEQLDNYIEITNKSTKEFELNQKALVETAKEANEIFEIVHTLRADLLDDYNRFKYEIRSEVEDTSISKILMFATIGLFSGISLMYFAFPMIHALMNR